MLDIFGTGAMPPMPDIVGPTATNGAPVGGGVGAMQHSAALTGLLQNPALKGGAAGGQAGMPGGMAPPPPQPQPMPTAPKAPNVGSPSGGNHMQQGGMQPQQQSMPSTGSPGGQAGSMAPFTPMEFTPPGQMNRMATAVPKSPFAPF